MSHKNRHIVTGVICATVGFGIAYALRKYRTSILHKFKFKVKNTQIEVVNTVKDCQLVTKNIQSRCSHNRVVGFDCEWVTVNGKRRPIALMQLATDDGFCALFRLCNMKEITPSLSKLLEDDTIIKVGVAPMDDALYLLQDYGIKMRGCLDLRYVADALPQGGLSGLAQHYLGVEMDKYWRIRCSDWEVDELSERQLQYASQDAFVAVCIFNKLMRPWWQLWGSPKWNHTRPKCQRFIDLRYKNKRSRSGVNYATTQRINKPKSRAFSTRQRPLYDNCILQAPEGGVLSTCDHRKAEWYVSKNLGEIVARDPLTVRLTFEPAGRAEGEVGKYYTTEKENQCVVCGDSESYIRKNVVPHEYRKFFPAVMKDHMSHDILLLCLDCHLRNNTFDVVLRQQLAEECNAPIGSNEESRVFEVPDFKKIRSAGRALLSKDAHKIPPERQKQLEDILRVHFGVAEEEQLSQGMLEEASNIIISVLNANYEPHGQRVVAHFAQNGGLINLELRWREHFLSSMCPQYLPPLWSVNHNHVRLTQRIQQGRISQEELFIAGLDSQVALS